MGVKVDELLSRQKRRSNTRGRRDRTEPTLKTQVEAPRRSNRRKAAAVSVSSEPVQDVVLGSPDPSILAAMYALVGFGLVMVYSASSVFADRTLHDANALIRNQGLHAALACSVAWIIGHYGDYRWLRRWTYPILFATLGLLIATVAGFGHA
ncbi:MAG: FtsW/RodA/SpoVE family cell cycle protein, partial [Polyangiales bacterium]